VSRLRWRRSDDLFEVKTMIQFFRTRLVGCSAFVLTMAISAAAFGQAQPTQPNPGPTAQPGNGQSAQPGQAGQGQVDRRTQWEGMMKSRDERLKTMLGATDDEFAILKPRIDNIQMINTRNMMQGFRMMMGQNGNNQNNAFRTRPSGDAQGQQKDGEKPAADPNAQKNPWAALMEETPSLVRAQELQAALESKDTPQTSIKDKLAALRAAKKQAKDELARAQEELRSLCTVRQEATLVMMGILE
jgi:hypothetical protein